MHCVYICVCVCVCDADGRRSASVRPSPLSIYCFCRPCVRCCCRPKLREGNAPQLGLAVFYSFVFCFASLMIIGLCIGSAILAADMNASAHEAHCSWLALADGLLLGANGTGTGTNTTADAADTQSFEGLCYLVNSTERVGHALEPVNPFRMARTQFEDILASTTDDCQEALQFSSEARSLLEEDRNELDLDAPDTQTYRTCHFCELGKTTYQMATDALQGQAI
eukprot:GHVU01033731.1.p1 GENE.GHVU01033731.1~~GHVU01033731.1.p1  ORF type:complete len:224 (+),score=42.03 GHVU01033731.1:233-904(+)